MKSFYFFILFILSISSTTMADVDCTTIKNTMQEYSKRRFIRLNHSGQEIVVDMSKVALAYFDKMGYKHPGKTGGDKYYFVLDNGYEMPFFGHGAIFSNKLNDYYDFLRCHPQYLQK
jgi:hypothetical protein